MPYLIFVGPFSAFLTIVVAVDMVIVVTSIPVQESSAHILATVDVAARLAVTLFFNLQKKTIYL
jgi:hypothetical protein